MRPSSEACLYASIASRIWRRVRRRSCSLVRWTASSLTGSATEASSATIATVITNSISVKPRLIAIALLRGLHPPKGHQRAALGRDRVAGNVPGTGGLRRLRREKRRRGRAAERAPARRSLGARGELDRARIRPLHGAQQPGGDEQHDLGLDGVVAGR